MKKLFVSAGLIAAGAASVQSVSAQDVVSPKAWSVGATLRGFYDDNYDVGNSKKGSAGAEVSPTISYNLPLRQTDMGIRYTYGLYYYQDRNDRSQNPFDQTHQLDAWIDHAFNENWHLNFNDTFAVGQEPELLQPNPTLQNSTPFRVNGNNIANHANVILHTQWTRELGTSLHYGNDFYHYQNKGDTVAYGGALNPFLPILPVGTPFTRSGEYGTLVDGSGNPVGASLAGLLDRVEQNIGGDVDWTFTPELMVFAGYTFSIANYTGDEPISAFNYNTVALAGIPPVLTATPHTLIYNSSARDSMSHEVHVGADWTILPNLILLGQVGAEYTDSYNDPLQHNTSVSPTANVSLSYTYTTGSYLQLGVGESQNATDIVTPDTGGNITQYQHSTVVYADINHRLTSKLMASLIGRYTYSTFEGGFYNSTDENEFNAGINLSYQINQHFNAEIGYNYDDLQTSVAGLQYDRNRVYVGVGATY